MSKLPLPKDVRPRDSHCQPEMPHPIPRPSDSWLMAHKEVIYDSTENWKKSNLLLRLGTVAINYDLNPSLSSDPVLSNTILQYSVKVAYKDRNGNPQVWRNLPFIQPDISPWIKRIIDELSADVSSFYVTQTQFNNTVNYLSNEISSSPVDTSRLRQKSGFDFLDCGTSTEVVSTDNDLQ